MGAFGVEGAGHGLAGSAAASAAPALDALSNGDGRDDQRGDGVEPPEAEERVAGEADEDGEREVGAEEVLCPLPAGGCDGAELVSEAAAMPRNGIPIADDVTRAMPSQLVSGCRR